MTMQVGFLPPPDYREAKTLEDFMVLGHIMTATPPINAIPAVVAAAPASRPTTICRYPRRAALCP